MGRRVSKVTQVIEEPRTGDPVIREEVFAPEQARHTSGSENYLNEDDSYKPRSSSPDNPFDKE